MVPDPAALSRRLEAHPALAAGLPGILRAAGSEAPLLILGEPGTGRSSLARLIHQAGRRSRGPMVEVDAAVIPSTLFESELFGYEAGAFTGAEESAAGRVARASGGTLLLDHLEELPRAAQPKLLRLVAEGRFSPLGGPESRADVRFIAIASADLPQRVERGAFRDDLYYRLSVLAYRLPALRERREDLATLLDELLGDLAERFGRPGARLTAAARGWILEHPWPGNLTQLRTLLERELVLSDDGVLDPEPVPVFEGASARVPRSLEEVERAEIRRALAYTRGHQGRAAKLLAISRKALWQKRKRFGIP